MNNDFCSELFSFDNDARNNKANKILIRETIKHAVRLYHNNSIDRDVLNTLVGLAMAWEISNSLDRKEKLFLRDR
jgi:hypothetical protein